MQSTGLEEQMKRLKRLFLMVVVSSFVLLGVLAGGEPNAIASDVYPYSDYYGGGIFATIGLNPSNKGIRSGISEGFGVRWKSLGIKISYIDNWEYDQDKIGIIPGSVGDLSGNATNWNNLGSKRTSGEFGFDADYFYDLNRHVSLYVGPGIYYQGYQNIRVSKGGSIVPVGYVDADGVKAHYKPSIEAGVHFNFPVIKYTYMLFGVGYHSERGVTADIGIRF